MVEVKQDSFQTMRKLFERDILASSIQEELLSCVSGDDVMSVKTKMNENGFDVIGVRETENTPIEGFIDLHSLQNITRIPPLESKNKFNASDLISDSTPLRKVLSILESKQRVFVLSNNEVSGIISKADLNKTPVYLFLFGMLNLLEMRFLQIIRERYLTVSSLQEELSESRYSQALSLYNERKKRNEEIDIFDCLQLCDKCNLISKLTEVRKSFGFDSKSKFNAFFVDVIKVRDNLAHAQEVITPSRDLNKILVMVNTVEKILKTPIQSTHCF